MKLFNKNYYFIGIGLAVVLAVVLIFINKGKDKGSDVVLSPSPTVDVSPIPSKTAGPKPGIKAEVQDNHDYLALQLDEDGNRRLVLNDDCSALVPSNVAYKNNVQVMLDNTYSKNPHTLRIGTTDYSLLAGEWRMVRLSSPTVPVQLPIYCGSMELGQIELQ